MENHGFLAQALIYLAAAVIAVPLSKRLGLGSVLGFLIAGIVIGPWGLKLIGDVEAMLHFSEFGVVLLLFLVGLELNPKRLWSLRNSIFGMGTLQVVSTMLVVVGIGIALLMQSVGLSAALGTFLAGVLLADSEYRHELELDIEPFKGLLLGLFFISVGMSVDLGLFVRVPVVVLGIALGIVALKTALLLAIARGFKLCGADGALFALGLSQIGEFAFVLFGVAATERILSRETANILNAAVAASMLSTPLLMILYEKVIVSRTTGMPSATYSNASVRL